MYVRNNEVAVTWTVCSTPYLEVEIDHLRTSPVLAVAAAAAGFIQEVVLVGVNLQQKRKHGVLFDTWTDLVIAPSAPTLSLLPHVLVDGEYMKSYMRISFQVPCGYNGNIVFDRLGIFGLVGGTPA